jgi:aminopeptidase N
VRCIARNPTLKVRLLCPLHTTHRSLVAVIVHEIVHSWFGNLVTNKTWSHFWLNEGFTRFAEMKIIGRMYGEPMRQASR